MKNFIPYGIILFILSCTSDTSVNFRTENLNTVFDLADKAGKLVLVDIYSDN